MNRRQFFSGLAAAAPLALIRQQTPQEPAPSQLLAPDMAGRTRDSVTRYENDPDIIAIERRLRCTCGCNLDVYTCRTTDFTCSYSPAMHRDVVALYESGKSADEVIQAFVAQYGETVLMAPPAEGFNWAAYLLPGTAILVTGGVLGWVLMRRHRVASVPVAAPADGGLSEADRARLAAELERLET